jgi:hypothetical protein
MWGKKEEENLNAKNQQELMVMLVKSQLKTEKHTERIRDNVLFYFYMGLLVILFFIFKTV